MEYGRFQFAAFAESRSVAYATTNNDNVVWALCVVRKFEELWRDDMGSCGSFDTRFWWWRA